MNPEKSDDGNGASPRPKSGLVPEGGDIADFYRQKAEECFTLAEKARDPEARDQWIKLANGWTVLARQAKA